jgi:diamine N-acetyltransferase
MSSSTATAGVWIRPAQPGDAGALSRFALRIFEDTFAKDNRPEDMAAYTSEVFTVERQAAEIAGPDSAVLLLFTGDDTLAGYAHVARGSAPPFVKGERPVELKRFYLDRPLHGSGAAGPLMEAVIERARAWQGDALWLGVWDRNPRAIGFYEKMRFRAVGQQTFYLGRDAQIDIVMSLPLT